MDALRRIAAGAAPVPAPGRASRRAPDHTPPGLPPRHVDPVVKLTYTFPYIFALTAGRALYVCRDGERFLRVRVQRGVADDVSVTLSPDRDNEASEELDVVVDFATDYAILLIVTASGAAYRTDIGGPDVLTEVRARRIALPERAISVTMNHDNTFLVMASGAVYAAGRNGRGQLGYARSSGLLSFHRLHTFGTTEHLRARQVAATYDRTFVLTTEGTLYCSRGPRNEWVGWQWVSGPQLTHLVLDTGAVGITEQRVLCSPDFDSGALSPSLTHVPLLTATACPDLAIGEDGGVYALEETTRLALGEPAVLFSMPRLTRPVLALGESGAFYRVELQANWEMAVQRMQWKGTE